NAAQKIIDDTSPSVEYTGTWLTAVGPDRFLNHTTHYTKVKGSTASLTFTGAVQVRLFGLGITNPVVDPMVDIIFDGTRISVSIARDEAHLRMTIWDSGTDLDPNVKYTLRCIKTSADGGDMDLYVDAFILTLPDSTTVSVSGGTPTAITSVTQTTSVINSSSPMTNVSIAADHSTISNIALDLPISTSPTASTTPTSETTNIITKDTGMSNVAKIGIALGVFAFICLCSAILFLLGRRKRVSDSFTHLNPYPLDDSNLTGRQDAECGEVERRMLPTPGILPWSRGIDTDAIYGLNRASGANAFTEGIPEIIPNVTGPPPYSPRSTSSSS
ncbi:hypothetical protein FRC18_008762, partial [Serendipita sp. 400]